VAHEWNRVILDEARTIKNPGTTVENRLSDLWTMFDFINPGLLGSSEEFSGFAKGLHQSPEGYAKLRRIISPYILRRLERDKTVISDLPEEVEMKTYASLTKKQLLFI